MDPHPNDTNNERPEMTSPIRRVLLFAITIPFNVLLALLKAVFTLLRPYSSQLIPVLVFFVLVPVLLFFSASAGWLVWNSAATSWEVSIDLQYGDGISPYANTALSLMKSQQRYDISVDLSVPLTEANLALGNFMTTLTLMTSANQTITSVRKPAIVLAPSRSYFKEHSVTRINIPMISSFLPRTLTTMASIEIGRKDRWTTVGTGHGQELSVVAASLRGIPVHRGIRGFVAKYPLISSSTAAAIFLMILVSVLGICMLPLVMYKEEQQDDASQTEVPLLPDQPQRAEPSDEDEHRAKRIKRSRSLGSISRRVSIRRELQAVHIPPAGPSNPLRQRRSRLLYSSDSET